MRISNVLVSLGLAIGMTLPSISVAQEQPLVLPDRSEVAAGEAYVAEIFRDWQVRCIRSEDDAIPDRCEMFQLLEEENGNPAAEMRIAASVDPASEVVATGTILTPLDTLLSPGLQLAIDDAEPATVPFAFCQAIGCFVQLALSADDIERFENGADTSITLFALFRDESGQMGGAPVQLLASLRGFTAAFEALEARMVDIRAFIDEQRAAAEAAAEGEGEAASE